MSFGTGLTVCDLPKILANHTGSGYVVAPAGHGKTHLIAQSAGFASGRHLILTHTYAGVNALRQKMRLLNINRRCYHVDTIASWSLRLSIAYKHTSEYRNDRPSEDAHWSKVYCACLRLLDHEFVRRILSASYVRVFVDEYQDCSVAQHEIVLKLARELPTVVLGDPLQGIFDFGQQRSVNWADHVETHFSCLGTLEEPHRWRNVGASRLGEWLIDVRSRLESGQSIDLRRNLPPQVKVVESSADSQSLIRKQGNACRYFTCDASHSVIAIHKGNQRYKTKCHKLAQNLSGKYSSIEEVEGKALFLFIRKLEESSANKDRLLDTVEFACSCMSGVSQSLSRGTKNGEYAKIRGNTRNPKVVCAANAFLTETTSENMMRLLESIRSIEGVKLFRRDLYNRAMGVLRKHSGSPDLTLQEAADRYQSEFRHRGRPIGQRRLIGTTLLVKGLEFDHAIVLDAATLSKKELYVALTRGARSLRIVSTRPLLNPTD